MSDSLLRYPGGKARAVSFLEEFIPSDTKEICSPFFGGGSLELALAKKGIRVRGYDTFLPLVSFWKSVLYNKEELVEKILKRYPISKEDFVLLQKQIGDMTNVIDIGAAYYVLNRSSFSGLTLSGGRSPNHPRFTLSQIQRIRDFDIPFEIEQISFEESIPLCSGCLIYADPPYLINQKLYGNKGDLHINFDRTLLASILNSRGNFILSYNDCEEVKDLYHLHKFIYPTWKYGLGNSKKSNEILILSRN